MKKALVIGMAKSGIAAAKLLASEGWQVTVNDSKAGVDLSDLEGFPVERVLGRSPDALVEDSDLIVVSPGVPLNLPFAEMAREMGKPLISELELGFRHLACPCAAVTGTNGKTTTVSLLGMILQRAGFTARVSGNIGDPLTGMVMGTRREDRMVIEVSSFMLEAVDTFRPKVSAILNITEDHLNRHGTMEQYIACKERIFANQREGDVLVLNYDDPITRAMARRAPCRVLFFSTRSKVPAGVCILEGRIAYIERKGSTPVLMGRPAEVRIPGEHNLSNAMAATAMAMAMGVSPQVVRYTLAAFEGVEHRIEYVATVGDVRYINDSKGTNVDSTLAAIRAMKLPTVLIAGGSDKHADFHPMIRGFGKNIRALVVMGQTGPQIEAAALDEGFTRILRADDLHDAVAKAASIAGPGWNVLLSPACASFDMFRDYEERGHMFKELVYRLSEAFS